MSNSSNIELLVLCLILILLLFTILWFQLKFSLADEERFDFYYTHIFIEGYCFTHYQDFRFSSVVDSSADKEDVVLRMCCFVKRYYKLRILSMGGAGYFCILNDDNEHTSLIASCRLRGGYNLPHTFLFIALSKYA